MKTLKQILDNTRPDHETGCMIWAGRLSQGKYPVVYAPDLRKGGEMVVQSGRKAVWQLAHGKPMPNGWRAFSTCGTDACVRPDHIKAQTCAEAGKKVRETGVWKNQITRISANRRTGRNRTELTPELIQYIRNSPETAPELKAKIGINRSSVSRIRTGKPTAFDPVGGIFTGLMR